MRIAIKLALVAVMVLCADYGLAKADDDKDKELTGIERIKAIHGNKDNCGHGNKPPCEPPPPPPPTPAPTPQITFNPASPVLSDTATVGLQITQIVVTMSNGSQFSGSLGFGTPYFSDGGICAIQGGSPPTVVLGAKLPPGPSTQNCTITATQ